MADFCRQCTKELFGVDNHDYQKDRSPMWIYRQLCEGCGFISVDCNGNCTSTKSQGCIKGHGYRPGSGPDSKFGVPDGKAKECTMAMSAKA